MVVDLSQLIVEHVIIHEIIQQNLRSERRPPVYSEIESSLNDDMKRYIKDKIINTVGSAKSYEIVFREDATSPLPERIRSLLSEETPLVMHSKSIADHLNEIQSGRSPGGLVTVVLGSIRHKHVVGILKLEKEEGVRLEQTSIDGLLTYDILHLKDLILTEKTRLFKIGLFFGDAFGSIDFDGVVCDNQMSYAPDREVADFFLEFLGCKLMVDPKIETKEFFVHSQGFFNAEIPDPIKQTEYNIHLVSYVTSQTGTLNPRTFASANLDTGHRQPYINYLTNKGVRVGNIRKDTTLIERRIKKVMIDFESGIKIVGEKEAFEDKVRLEQTDDGRTRAEIVDNIKKVGT
jgi:nucleoid-associated protein YejK